MTVKHEEGAPLGAEAAQTAEPLINTERLRSHLKPGSLAAALVSAWEAGDQANVQGRLLTALQEFKEEGDAE